MGRRLIEMNFTVKRLMWAVAIEACLIRAALTMAASRGIPRVFGEIFGIWFTLNWMCVLPAVIWALRSRSFDRLA
jgi:hypothetical protein